MKAKREKFRKSITAWICALVMIAGCFSGFGNVLTESKAADTGYTELTFSDFGLKDYTYTGNGAGSAASITSWDKVAVSGTIALPKAGASYIRFGGNKTSEGIEIKYGGDEGARKLRMMLTADANTESQGLQATDMGYEDGEVANREIFIRLTFDAIDNGANYLVTLEGTGESGQKATATLTVSKEALVDYKMNVSSNATDKPVSIYSESIKTSKDTYTSEEKIQVNATSKSGDWVGVFEESATVYTQETAKAWYSVADSNGTMNDIVAQIAGNYKICLMMNESTVLLSKNITVERYVEKTYTELTFSDFNIDNGTLTANKTGESNAITTWDNVAFSGTIKLPEKNASKITFGTDRTVDNGVMIRNEGSGVIKMALYNTTNEAYISGGLQAADLGYEEGESLAGKEIVIRLTFDPVNDGTDYLVTLKGIGESGQADIATMTVPKSKLVNQKVVFDINSTNYIDVYSESIKTYKDTYESEWETIPVTATARRGEWVGIFEENAIAYTKENAKVWYDVTDYNGAVYNLPAQEVGTYRIGLMMDTRTMLCSKTITVTQNSYKEYTFRDFGLDDQTVLNSAASGQASITSWDKVALSGVIKLPTAGSAGYIRIAGNASLKGIEIKGGGGSKVHLGVSGGTVDNGYPASDGLQASDMGYAETLADAKITIRLMFDAVDDGYLVTLEGAGESGQKDTVSMTVPSSVLSNYSIVVQSISSSTATDKEFIIASTKKTVEASDVSYNIEEEPYLLTGNYTVIKNGETVTVEDATTPILNKAGDYEVTTTWNGVTSSRTVSLYKLGDVNLDNSTTVTNDDVVALRAILAGTVEATTAQEKAADLTNDGVVNNTDLKLLQDIVSRKQTRADIIDKYYPAAVRYEYLETDGSAVMPIVGFEGGVSTDATHYKELKEAGINMILSNSLDYQDALTKVDTILELSQEAGLGYLVKDNRLHGLSYNSEDSSLVSNVNPADVKTMREKMGSYSYFDSYLGNFVMDEPTLVRADGMYITPKVAEDVRNFDNYETITNQLNSYANTSGYINLPAAVWYAGEKTSEGYNGNTNGFHLTQESIEWYEKVVKDITENGNAKVLSFDRYVSGAWETPGGCPRYFLNLDIIRTQAKAKTETKTSEIPFWAYVPVGQWAEGTSTEARPNTAESMYWQANTSLAFGAKGIQYFTTTEPSRYSEDGYDMGMYSSNGTKNNDWYNAVDRMNTLIEAVDDVLMKSENKGIIATGGNALNNAANITYTADGTTALTMGIAAASDYIKDNTPDYSAIKSEDGVSRVEKITTTNEEAGAFAGVFNYQGKVALYIVNNDTASAQDITVNFTDASNYRVIGFNADNTIDEVTALGSSCTRNVKAGEAFLIVIDEEALETTTQYFDDISEYRVDGAYTAPELDGYVFAGWYKSEEAATKEYTYDTTTETTASDEEKLGAIKEYKELTFYSFGQTDRTVSSGSDGVTTAITSWDNVAINGTITLPAGGNSQIAFGHPTGVTIKYGGVDYIRMVVPGAEVESEGLQKADLGYAEEESLAGIAIPIRLTFEPIGDNYLITLEGTGKNGQKDIATVTAPKEIFTVYKMYITIGTAGSITISSTVPTRVQPAYAKFVDESILSVKAQITDSTTATSAKTNMRLVTTVDSLIYQNVGFKVCTEKVPNGIEKDITNVYRRIVATSGGIKFPYTPSVFSTHSEFFATVTVENLAVAGNTDKELRITPYWKTLDGTKVYGVTRTLTLADGIAAIAAVQ